MGEEFKKQIETKIDSAVNRVAESSNVEEEKLEQFKKQAEKLRLTLKTSILQDNILDEDKITDDEWQEIFVSLPKDLLVEFRVFSHENLKAFIEGPGASFDRSFPPVDARIKMQEIINSQVVQDLLKEIQEETKYGQEVISDFFSSLNLKKTISASLGSNLETLSRSLNIPISFYYFEDPNSSYSVKQIKDINTILVDKFNTALNNGRFLSPISKNSIKKAEGSESFNEAYRKILHMPDNEDLNNWLQLSFTDNPIREKLEYIENGVKKSATLKEKFPNIDIQKTVAKRMSEVMQKISPGYKDLIPLLKEIIFVPEREPSMAIGTTDLTLTISLDLFLDEKNYSTNDLAYFIEHELVHIKHNLIVYKEQQEKTIPSMQSKLESIINGEIPKGYQLKVLADKPLRNFWREQIPDDIFLKIATEPNKPESDILQAKVDILSDEDKKRLNDSAIYTGKKIIPKKGFIHPYAAVIYLGEYLFNGRVSTNNFLIEQITVIVQTYNDDSKKFLSEAYNVDTKIKKIVDEVLIPYGFLPSKL